MSIDQSDSASRPGRVLVTALGLDPKPGRYELRGSTYEAKLAPVALVNLLPPTERPDVVYALCTQQSGKDTYQLLVQELEGICVVQKIDVPDGATEESLPEFLGRVTHALPAEAGLELIVDFTHGYRHHTFLTFMAALYLSALRRARIRAAYYGLLGGLPPRSAASTAASTAAPSPPTSRLLDVRPLLELPRWFHAVEMLETTGSAAAMAGLIAEYGDRDLPVELSALLRRLTESYQSGLPLELGRDVAQLQEKAKPLKRLLRQRHLPLANELVDQMADRLDVFQPALRPAGDGWKGSTPLDEAELRRQAALIDSLQHNRALPAAYGLMREWTVSWVLWRLGTTDRSWKKETRRSAESWLGRLLNLRNLDPSPLTEEQRRLAEFWQQLASVRNAYHHHGMREGVVASTDDQFGHRVGEVDQYWQELRECPPLDLELPVDPTGTILISPIGTRPGVLYSAVEAARARSGDPDHCLVICSAATEASAAEALDRAGFAGHRDLLRLRDPYGGTNELDRAVEERVRTLLGADRVYVNLTGGTTLMGLLADRFAQQARELGPQVHRFGLVDRRPQEEQAADPYRAGEPYWLDDEERTNELG